MRYLMLGVVTLVAVAGCIESENVPQPATDQTQTQAPYDPRRDDSEPPTWHEGSPHPHQLDDLPPGSHHLDHDQRADAPSSWPESERPSTQAESGGSPTAGDAADEIAGEQPQP